MSLLYYRSYQLVATASKDHSVRIYKLTPAESGYVFTVNTIAEFSDHGAEVYLYHLLLVKNWFVNSMYTVVNFLSTNRYGGWSGI